MTEVLGVAAGALGIASFGIQLADSVVKLKRFCGEVKGVPRKLHRLTDELEIMTEALSTFTVDYEKLLATKNPVRKSLALCKAAVKDLASTINALQERLGRRKRITSIHAALRREEVDDLVETMERTRNLLDFVSRVYLEAQRQDELSSILVHCRMNSSAASPSISGMAVSQPTTEVESVAKQETEAIRRPPVPTSGALTRARALKYRASWWLFSQVWELSVERATSGWKFSLRFQRTLPKEHRVNGICLFRDMGGMQRLISDGEVLPDDKISIHSWPTLSLITISAAYGRLNVVRFLLSQGVGPRTLATEWELHIVRYQSVLTRRQSFLSQNLALNLVRHDSTLDTIIEDVKLLSEHGIFENKTVGNQEFDCTRPSELWIDLFLQPRASWSMYDNLRTFCSIVLNFPKASARFLHLVEPAVKERAYFAVELDIPNRSRLMHLLAGCAGAMDEHQWQAYKDLMAALVATDIQAGSDLHLLSKTGAGMTPLMHALLGAMLSFEKFSRANFDRDIAAVQQRFQRWLFLLAMAGVDLSRFAKREARLFRRHWRASQRVLWKSFFQHCEVIALRFGSKATEWGLWVSHPGDCYSGLFWDMVEHPERSIPGAWTESEEVDPEPSVLRYTPFLSGYGRYKLLDSDRIRWPDDLDFFED
ncbi:hypothetical protein D0862_13796 [Hortaea werneckii]|uniref:Fungal N-terminal domain-containing protein n=1 Tax=Hortaea werneckii TaxID=91943 RepID=A0A3M7EJ04_HORWE|nr:hypothetical protein D0862_13796 [Hortaea werneckii]